MIPKDKIKHFLVGIVAAPCYLISSSQTFMWLVILILALGKEAVDALDSKKTTHAEFMDIVATCLPAMIISLLIWLYPNLQ
jgi:hypothetical protein